MSYSAMAWARKQVAGSPARKALLLAIANYADEDGVCWPSQERLAQDTEMSKRTIIRTLQELEDVGLLERVRRSTPLGRQTDVLKLRTNQGATVADSLENKQGANLALRGTQGDKSAQQGANLAPKPFIEPVIKESSLRSPKKGHRLPEDWKPDEDLLEFAINEGLTNQEFNRATDEFRDYWHAMSGMKATKLDWTKTFRNRLREVADRKRRGSRNGTPHTGWLDRVDRAFAGIRRELSSDEGGEDGEPVYSRLSASGSRGRH